MPELKTDEKLISEELPILYTGCHRDSELVCDILDRAGVKYMEVDSYTGNATVPPRLVVWDTDSCKHLTYTGRASIANFAEYGLKAAPGF
jgi:hypothetical protein